MIECRDRILPQQFFFWNQRAEIAGAWAHITMGQLVPRAGKSVCELIRVFVETLRNRGVEGIHPQGKVCRKHRGGVPLRGIVSIRDSIRRSATLRYPLIRTSRALRQFPFISEQNVEEAVIP